MDLLIGGPGTGKTTALVNKIREMKPTNFALLSFTRQAANEAKSRLKTMYSDKELDWVRTIHSLAFRVLRLNRGSMFTDNHLKDFGNECGFEFPNIIYYNEDDGTFDGLTQDQITYRQMIITETLGLESSKEDTWDYDAINYMRNKYVQYKAMKKLLDFNDILKMCIDIQMPKFDLLCIDEAQDLSPLQFYVVDKLVMRSKHIIYAGDDDQMIYEWAGVKRSLFMNLASKCNQETLTINHRLLPEIITKSQGIIEKCKDRIVKPRNIPSRNYELNVMRRVEGLDEINFIKDQTYLILVRNNVFLRMIKDQLNELEIKWSYLKSDGSATTNVRISTIHGSKGAEADNIILFTDCTNATYQHITSDSEHRVWYVAMTRTKNSLIIVDPQSKYNYEI